VKQIQLLSFLPEIETIFKLDKTQDDNGDNKAGIIELDQKSSRG
jgi:hypothetical protein